MKIPHLLVPLFSSACAFSMMACTNGSGGGGAAAAANARAEAEAFKAAADQAALNAPVKSGEFTITITPDADATSANAIPVHILSLNATQVAQYKTMGADNYWKSPSGSAQSRVFGASGTRGSANFKVPSKDGADTVLIIAKLPPPSGGGDARIMEVPLKRTVPAEPGKPATQPPISVRLGSLGLLPN